VALSICKELRDAALVWRMNRGTRPRDVAELREPLRPGEDPFHHNAGDPWGTPCRLEWRGDELTVRSAGPDRAFGTGDDVAYPPPD